MRWTSLPPKTARQGLEFGSSLLEILVLVVTGSGGREQCRGFGQRPSGIRLNHLLFHYGQGGQYRYRYQNRGCHLRLRPGGGRYRHSVKRYPGGFFHGSGKYSERTGFLLFNLYLYLKK